MPHHGELLSILGTLRGEGRVYKRDNSLVVMGDELTTEDGDFITTESGDYILTEG